MTNTERAELARLQQLAADENLTPYESAACCAWNEIRGTDPEFTFLPMEMRHKLVHLAEKALAGRAEKEGDYAPAGFFAAVNRRDAFSARSVDVERRERAADRRETESVFFNKAPDAPFTVDNSSKTFHGAATGVPFSDDTSTHAPNENAVIADPNGPPVPESDVSTDARLPEFNEFDGENRRVADLPFDHPERRFQG